MGIDQQDVQVQCFDQVVKTIVKQPDIIALTQDVRDLVRFDTGRDEEYFALNVATQALSHVVRGLLNVAFAPQIVVERMHHLVLFQAEQDMNAR